MKYIFFFTIIIILFIISVFISNKENFINYGKNYRKYHDYRDHYYDDSYSYGPYFMPYYLRPTTCVDTLFGGVQCYTLPEKMWSDNWSNIIV